MYSTRAFYGKKSRPRLMRSPRFPIFYKVLLEASPADIRNVCVSASAQKAPNLRCCFLTRRLTNTPQGHRLADGQLSPLYPPSPSFSSFGVASVICCSAPPASSSTPLRTSVYYPSMNLVLNIIYIPTFCEYLNILYIFDPTLYFDCFIIACLSVLCTIIRNVQQ